MTPVTAWRVHVGAHKTATTHLQDRLAANRERIAEQGVDFLPRAAFRKTGFVRARGRANWWHRLPPIASRPRYGRAIKRLRLGPSTVAISEENLCGSVRHTLGAPVYSEMESRLAGLRALSRASPMHVFLSIRSFDELLPSAYAQGLRGAPIPGGFEAVAAAARAEPPRWTGLVERLMALLPDAELTVWTMEAYRADADAVVTRFLGVDPGPLESAPPPSRTVTPPAEAVAEAERVSGDLPFAERFGAVHEIYLRWIDRGGARFAPLDDPSRARLRDAYEADLVALRRRLGERFVHPGSGVGAAKPSARDGKERG